MHPISLADGAEKERDLIKFLLVGCLRYFWIL